MTQELANKLSKNIKLALIHMLVNNVSQYHKSHTNNMPWVISQAMMLQVCESLFFVRNTSHTNRSLLALIRTIV